jgi:glucose-1-phosphate cytidylyltransferase
MKVVILCGGIGYRLKEETEFKPKPMVQVGGKPILWHIMKIYAHFGFNDFIIALGYKGDYIKQYFLNQKHFAYNFTIHTYTGHTSIHKNNQIKDKDNFKITFVDTGAETLPGERILRIKDFIPKEDSDFMVTYGDGVGNVDIKDLLRFHRKQKTIGTVIGVHPRSKYGLLAIDKENIIEKFIEKPVLSEWVNGGFMVFKRNFFDYLRPGEMEHNALKRLIKKKQLSLYAHDGFWHSMDTYPDVDTLNKLWKDNPEWKVWR